MQSHILLQDCISPRSQIATGANFVPWHLTLSCPQYDTSLCHPSGGQNFDAALRFLENLCIPNLLVCNKEGSCVCVCARASHIFGKYREKRKILAIALGCL